MSWSFVGSNTASGSSVTSLSLSKPAGTQDGDLIILASATWNSTISMSGFTTIDSMQGNQSTNHKALWAYKIAASEGSSWSISYGTSTWPIGVVYVLRGVAKTSPLANHAALANASAYTTSLTAASGSISQATDGTVYLYTGIDSAASGSESATLPGGLSSPLSAGNSTLGGVVALGYGVNVSSPGAATNSPDALDYMDGFADFLANTLPTPPAPILLDAIPRSYRW